MSKENKSKAWIIGLIVLTALINMGVSRFGGKQDQIENNKVINIQQCGQIEQNSKSIQEVKENQKSLVTKEYFDQGLQMLKEYIDK